jgi:hypothetical protein
VCTVVVSLLPGERVPLRLLGIRDETVNRPWRPPARHWPGLPLVGGIDEQAGGTWLAVAPGAPRVACLLNGRGVFADPARRRSRGELPLRAAAEGPGALEELAGDRAALAAYDPFHLICASPDAVTVLSYVPGERPPVPPEASPMSKTSYRARDQLPGVTLRALAPGTHLFSNAGHAFPAEEGDPVDDPKAAHFADKFAAARPPASPGLPLAEAWGDWLTLAAGDGLDPAGPAAIMVRRTLPDGRLYGTTSATLVALPAGPGRAEGIRYDFQPQPGDSDGWYSIHLGE